MVTAFHDNIEVKFMRLVKHIKRCILQLTNTRRLSFGLGLPVSSTPPCDRICADVEYKYHYLMMPAMLMMWKGLYLEIIWARVSIMCWHCSSILHIDGELHDDVIKWKSFPRYWPFISRDCTGHGEFPTHRPVTRSFDVFFDPRLNKRLSKQLWRRWFETPSRSLWRHCNRIFTFSVRYIWLMLRMAPTT